MTIYNCTPTAPTPVAPDDEVCGLVTLEDKKRLIFDDLHWLRDWMAADGQPQQLVEMRIMNHPQHRTISGYYDNYDILAAHAASLDGQANIFATLNDVNPDLKARCYNDAEHYAKHTTSDADVVSRRFLLVDCDPKRVAGVSASDAEHDAALNKGREIHAWLKSNFGWKSIFSADSGNGCHLLLPLNITPDGDHSADDDRVLAENCLKYLDSKFSDEVVKIDVVTGNAARICKLYGTMAVKGDNLPERPHRRSKLLYAPKEVVALTREELTRLGSLYTPPAAPVRAVSKQTNPRSRATRPGEYLPVNATANEGQGFLVPWLTKMAIPYTIKQDGADTRYIVSCPFNSAHDPDVPAVWEAADGKLCYKCFHDSCASKGWSDFRLAHEPDYKPVEVSTSCSAALMAVNWNEYVQKRGKAVEWVWEDTIPRGHVSIIAGQPKAGKSIFVRNLIKAIVNGGSLLGRGVERGKVVYMPLEESAGSMAAHFERLNLRNYDDLIVPVLRDEYGDIREVTKLDDLRAIVAKEKPVAVIINPVKNVMPGVDFNSYDAVYPAFMQYRELATEFNLAVIFLHHTNKSESEELNNQMLGSTGITAAVSTSVFLKIKDNVRYLSSQGRDIVPFERLVIEGGYDCSVKGVGSLELVAAEKYEDEIIEILNANDNEPMTKTQILDQLDGDKTKAGFTLSKMGKRGKLVEAGTGGERGTAKLWQLPTSIHVRPRTA